MENNENKIVSETEKKARDMKGFSIAAMVLGIFSIVGTQGNLVGIASAVIALIFASKVKKAGIDSTFAVAGKITAFVGLGVRAISVVTTVLYVAAFVMYYVIVILVIAILSITGAEAPEFYYGFEDFLRCAQVVLG